MEHMVSFVEAMEFLSTSAAVTPCVMRLDFFGVKHVYEVQICM